MVLSLIFCYQLEQIEFRKVVVICFKWPPAKRFSVSRSFGLPGTMYD